MIYIPEVLKRTFDRIEEVHRRDIQKHKSYFSSVTVGDKTYTGTDTIRVRLESFLKFRAELENGTSPLLQCENGYEEVTKVKLMYAVWEFFEPFWVEDIHWIENDVIVSEELISRLNEYSRRPNTEFEAKQMLSFIKDAYQCSWGMDDAKYQIRDFRLVTRLEDFESVLNLEGAEDLTDCANNLTDYTTIRVALVPVSRIAIYQQKGIFEDYCRFIDDLFKNPKNKDAINDGMKVWDIWHDVRETAIYYVYAPNFRGRKPHNAK